MVTAVQAGRPGAEVPNLTVNVDHDYYVGAAHQLVHTEGCGDAAKTVALEARETEIHGALDPIAQTRRTTAALSTEEGRL